LVETPEGWYCDDAAEKDFAFEAWLAGFDLIEYDQWLRALPDCPARAELFKLRGEAKSEMDWQHKNRLFHFLWNARTAIERDLRQRPLADKGESFSRLKPKGAVSETTRYLRAQRGQGETARELWARLKYASRPDDDAPVYFDGDTLVEKKTEKEISFRAFEKRLSAPNR